MSEALKAFSLTENNIITCLSLRNDFGQSAFQMVGMVQLHLTVRRFSSVGGGDDDNTGPVPFQPSATPRDDLPYRVELWDQARTSVEQVLAVASNGAIGYAAYYAATREHPQRYITLRHNNRIVSRWNGPSH